MGPSVLNPSAPGHNTPLLASRRQLRWHPPEGASRVHLYHRWHKPPTARNGRRHLARCRSAGRTGGKRGHRNTCPATKASPLPRSGRAKATPERELESQPPPTHRLSVNRQGQARDQGHRQRPRTPRQRPRDP
jgi:hypothetical protein